MKDIKCCRLLKSVIVWAVITLSACGAYAAEVAVQSSPEQPGKAGLNVLFLMTDQQHHASLGITGNKLIETPNMDRLARQGALFELATCPTPFCSPTRASIITGLWPHTHGLVENYYDGSDKGLKDSDFPNTETILNHGGYATGHRGKWHIGPMKAFSCYENLPYPGRDYNKILDKQLPAEQFADKPGNDKYIGRPVYMIPAVVKGQECFHKLYPESQHRLISMIGRTAIPVDLLPEANIANQVMEMMEKNAGQNWMITASWHPPHAMWVSPDPYYSMVERSKIKLPDNMNICPEWMLDGFSKQLGTCMGPEGIREYIGVYQSQVAMIDYYLGRVLKKLDDLGLADKTLVIFTSDHGDMQGQHGMMDKSIPAFYEAILRVPLLIRLPGKIKPGTVIKEPVSLVDLMPTILDYTGVASPAGVQGKSLRPLLEGRAKNWRKYSFSERRSFTGRDAMLMIRGERYKYIFRENKHHELFDLVNDPYENENKFSDPASRKIILELHQELLRWMGETKDPYLPNMPPEPFG